MLSEAVVDRLAERMQNAKEMIFVSFGVEPGTNPDSAA
jgi:hypothetical protein